MSERRWNVGVVVPAPSVEPTKVTIEGGWVLLDGVRYRKLIPQQETRVSVSQRRGGQRGKR